MNQKNHARLNPSEADLKKSITSWFDEVDAINPSADIDDVPEGWMTIEDMAKYKGCPLTTMSSRMIKRLNAGIVQRKKYRIKSGRGVLSVWHYYKS